MFSVFAPYHERIVEDAAVHSNCSVNIVLGERGSADYHAVGEVMVLATFCDLSGKTEIFGIEYLQII